MKQEDILANIMKEDFSFMNKDEHKICFKKFLHLHLFVTMVLSLFVDQCSLVIENQLWDWHLLVVWCLKLVCNSPYINEFPRHYKGWLLVGFPSFLIKFSACLHPSQHFISCMNRGSKVNIDSSGLFSDSSIISMHSYCICFKEMNKTQ